MPHGIIHLAAKKQARESSKLPWDYWSTNIGALLGVLNAAFDSSVRHIIQSSSCSIYGSAKSVSESSVFNPQSTYGWTKAISERILEAFSKQAQVPVTSLRYFNVIGCDDFSFSFDNSSECLVPITINRISNDEPVLIYGNNFQTEDGTALRDYLDVRDLASAHILATKNPPIANLYLPLNVATGEPVSVKKMVDLIFEIFEVHEHPINFLNANPEDPAAIWAIPSETLVSWGWTPKHNLVKSLTDHKKNLTN